MEISNLISLNILAEAAPAGLGGMTNIAVMLLMLAGFWFLLIAPQRKRQKAHEQMLSALSAGDDVLTSGGLYATIAQVKEDRLVLKVSDGVKMEFHKSAVQSKLNGSEPAPKK
jgi:preprotein translocase subunit YajC